MTFSEKLHVSEVERREPQDKEEWITRIAKILLCDRKKHEVIDGDGYKARRENKNVESYKSRNRCK